MEIVAKEELRRLSDFQNVTYHAPNKIHTKIDSEFIYSVNVITWYSGNEVTVEKQENNRVDGIVTVRYPLIPTQSYLKKCEIRVIFPRIAVKKKYLGKIVICLPHNPAIKTIDGAEFMIKEHCVNGHAKCNYWQNVAPQYVRSGDERNFNLGVGNYKFLENWCNVLPKMTFNIEQFFGMFYSKMNFPVFLACKDDRMNVDIAFRYTYNLNLKNLVRMGEVQPDGTIIPIDFRNKYILGPEVIEIPNMVLRYNYVTDDEVKFIKEKKLNGDKEEDRVIRKFFKDVVCYSQNDGFKYGKEHPIILESKSPAIALFWSAENKRYKDKYNIHANYTSDANNVYDGYNMIKNSSLMYGPLPKFKDFEPDQVELAQPRNFMPKCPMDPGYNCYALCNNPFGDNVSPGNIMANKDTTLHVKIFNTDPRCCTEQFADKDKAISKQYDPDEDSSDDDVEEVKREIDVKEKNDIKDKYIVHVAIMTLRTMEIKKVEGEKDVYNFQII